MRPVMLTQHTPTPVNPNNLPEELLLRVLILPTWTFMAPCQSPRQTAHDQCTGHCPTALLHTSCSLAHFACHSAAETWFLVFGWANQIWQGRTNDPVWPLPHTLRKAPTQASWNVAQGNNQDQGVYGLADLLDCIVFLKGGVWGKRVLVGMQVLDKERSQCKMQEECRVPSR